MKTQALLLEILVVPLLIANLISTLSLKPTAVSAAGVADSSSAEVVHLAGTKAGCPKTPKGGN